MLLKIITNTLEKVLFSDDKNTQQVHNICCSRIKIDLRCNFIVMRASIDDFPGVFQP